MAIESNIFFSHIVWLTAQQGGRKVIPPKGTTYMPLIRFEGVEADGAWSVVFICDDVGPGMTMDVKMQFFSPDAPYQVRPGLVFGLYEGAKLIARGVVSEEDKGTVLLSGPNPLPRKQSPR